MNLFSQKRLSTHLYKIIGSFGEFLEEVSEKDGSFSAKSETVSVTSDIEKDKNGVFVRHDKIKNISDEKVTLNAILSKFRLNGGEYEVYSQYNGWLSESLGGWQPLVSSVGASSKSLRCAQGASPFMVLWSNQENRGTAFHYNAYSAWEMKFTKVHIGGESTEVEAEFGILGDGLEIELMPGEEFELPEIIYYTVFNRVGLDCFKLHAYLNEKYPRKTMPVIYNTWLYRFDGFNFENVCAQIPKAVELGVEYFVIDAGWFGNGRDWWSTRGDWEENLTFGFRGRMKEIADLVRKAGMKFGLWLETECASAGANVLKEYPEFFIKADSSYFLDFANADAVKFIYDKTCEVIDKYGAEFIKFDFNADLTYDKYRSAFTKYFEGHSKYIKMIKERYPDIYIENCASGGARLSVRDGKLYDSYWPSDNQSPYHSLRIFKDTILRVPPQWIECWATICSVKDVAPVYGKDELAEKIIATNDGTWDSVVGVHDCFLKGFFTGSPVGFSCDLTSFSEKTMAELKDFIVKFKKNREFYKNAVCHILVDTKSMLVLEYRNSDFSQIELVVFTHKMMQNHITIYPAVDENASYKMGDSEFSGEELTNCGIDVDMHRSYIAQFRSLTRIENK